MTYMKKKHHFFNLKKTHYRRTDGPTDRPTDGPTDRPTDGRTDTPSYRDGWTHLKIHIRPLQSVDSLVCLCVCNTRGSHKSPPSVTLLIIPRAPPQASPKPPHAPMSFLGPSRLHYMDGRTDVVVVVIVVVVYVM